MRVKKLHFLFALFGIPIISASNSNSCSINKSSKIEINKANYLIENHQLLEDITYSSKDQRNESSSLKIINKHSLNKLKLPLYNIVERTQAKLNTCKARYRSYKEKRRHKILKKYIRIYSSLERRQYRIRRRIIIPIEIVFFILYINKKSVKKKIQKILNSVIDINQQNDEGLTALHTAACCGSYEVVKLLINAGSNLDKKDDEGLTAISLAKEFKNNQIIKLLIREGASLKNTSLENLNFKKIDFNNVNFSYSDLRMTNFSGAKLRDTDFRGAFLCVTKFRGANLNHAIIGRKQINKLNHTYSGTIIVWEDFIEDCLIPKWEREISIELPKVISLFIIDNCFFC